MKARSIIERRMRALEAELIPQEALTKRWLLYLVATPADRVTAETKAEPFAEVVWTPSPARSTDRR